MTKLLFVNVSLAETLLLMVGQAQPLKGAEAQDDCDNYSLAEAIEEGWMLKNCGGNISYVLPLREECDLDQDGAKVFGCVSGDKKS
jgi:hypothetical protein